MNTNQSLCVTGSRTRRAFYNIYIVLFPFALGSFINKVNIYTQFIIFNFKNMFLYIHIYKI